MIKPNWDTEELIENWTLLPQELKLAKKKVGGNQIGFALLLKHFQLFAYFPEDKSSISQAIISYIASPAFLTQNAIAIDIRLTASMFDPGVNSCCQRTVCG